MSRLRNFINLHVITLAPAALRMLVAQEGVQTSRKVMLLWLERNNGIGRMIGSPRREDSDADIREGLIVSLWLAGFDIL
jgi:hypothetical protein